ncbi:MAG TPA: DsbA family protein [Patescibacteria group bacterium]|nr:DsbA family protein [Patescibacteria group bacterium]
MLQKYLSKFVLPAVAAVALLVSAPAQAENFTKDQINEMIGDYIKANPQVILQAVNDYQTREMSEKQEEALKRNHDEIFRNEKSPFLGNKDGDVTIVEFFDYNCHYCKDVFPVLRDLTKEDPKLKVIFKDFPILGPASEVGAKWALAAQRQDKYFEFHQKLMDHKGPLKNEDIEAAAKDIGLDLSAARSYVDGTDVMMQIERNRTLAGQMNFNGTPSFIVNDEAFSGVPDAQSLKEKIASKRAALKDKGSDGHKKDEKKAD